MGFSSPPRRDPHAKLIIALEARPLPCPDDGPRRRAADPTVEEREIAGVPTSRLPPVKLDFLPNSGVHPPRISPGVFMFLLRGSKQTLCGNENPYPKSTERKSRCEAPVSPGKQQYIPKHCPTLCYML